VKKKNSLGGGNKASFGSLVREGVAYRIYWVGKRVKKTSRAWGVIVCAQLKTRGEVEKKKIVSHRSNTRILHLRAGRRG